MSHPRFIKEGHICDGSEGRSIHRLGIPYTRADALSEPATPGDGTVKTSANRFAGRATHGTNPHRGLHGATGDRQA